MTGTLKVDQIQNNTGVAAITIDSAGGVTFPNNPVVSDNKYPFVATMTADQSLSNNSNTVVQYNTTSAGAGLDQSGVFSTSNYRMIAPVAGYYWVGANVRTQNMGNGRCDMLIRRNGAGVMAQGQNQQNANDYGWSAMGIIQCAVNDYIDIVINANGGNNTTITNTSNTGAFSGSQTMSLFIGYLIQAT